MSFEGFRLASTADAATIATLVNTAYRPKQTLAGWTHESDWVDGDRTHAAQVTAMIQKPDSVILLGLNHSEIVACVHIEKDGNTSHIGMLAVMPREQTNGWGKRILSHAENYAATVFKAEQLELVVVSTRRELLAFYSRRGYQTTGIMADYPVLAGAGSPKKPNLKIETLQKQGPFGQNKPE